MLNQVCALAETAGREIKKIYESGDWDVTAKKDASPLTQADLAANAVIVEGLKTFSKDVIVSEECELPSIQDGQTFWLVDPLDGTRDFVARLDTFVVCIARIENHYPTLGVIHAPVTGETWWAEKSHGCFGPQGQKLINMSRRTELIALGSRSTPSERMQGLYEQYSIKEVRRFGSALKFCKIAEGVADLYPRFGPTSEWDTAAGQIIVEEAGCRVRDLSTGVRLRYGKPGFENRGGFIVARSDLALG